MMDYCFFSACGFVDCDYVRSVLGLVLLFLFMWTNFSLQLAEFRPCEGDQPLPKPKGWTPTLFSFWCGSVALAHLKYAK